VITFVLVLIFLQNVSYARPADPGCVSKSLLAAKEKPEFKLSKERFRMRPEEEDGGLALSGSVNGAKPAELGYIQYYTWPEADGTDKITISFVQVNEKFRGHGISGKLYKEMLSRLKAAGKKPSKITSEALAATNKDAALGNLIMNLSSKPGFIKPDPALSLEKQFISCCKDIFEQFPEEQVKAVAETPAHRAHHEIGFSEICQATFKINRNQVHVVLASCVKK